MTSTPPEAAIAGPVLFAYDGSELAELAIEQASQQLAPGRDALVLCVWQPADVGFIPVDGRHLDAQNASAVQKAAQQTAAHGASLAEKTGSGRKAWQSRRHRPGRASSKSPRTSKRASSCSAPTAAADSSGTYSAALPPPSSLTQHSPYSSCISAPEALRPSGLTLPRTA